MNATKTPNRKQPEGPSTMLQREFVSRVLPAVERHAKIYFRHVKCPDRKADLIAEAVGLAWRWFRRLAQRGMDGTQFPTAIAGFAARAVNSGRRVCGQEKVNDVLSPLAQRRHAIEVVKLPDFATLSGNPLDEALHDNTRSPVDEQAAFRIDFAEWLHGLGSRRRDIITDMGMGCRT